uniref:L-type lectin-like domain-containing protein n=1 Tax=Ditylenchus dipsaci TaxID=166011 RepID=A0A915D987_9BILA
MFSLRNDTQLAVIHLRPRLAVIQLATPDLRSLVRECNQNMSLKTRLLTSLLFSCLCSISLTDTYVDVIDGSSSSEFRGYYKREHSLIRPYQGAGMEVPYWEIMGSTIVSHNKSGLLPIFSLLKEQSGTKCHVMLSSWSTGTLFGDGLAIWYVQEPYQLGEVFGSKDYFRGLAVFLDTYSNHNGPHSHSHPYITAMVNNGSLHYDHDSDGTILHLVVNTVAVKLNTLTIFTDVLGEQIWKQCLSVPGVRLPTGYYFGVSATTGELSDNHDIHSIRTFEQEFTRVERQDEADTNAINPEAQNCRSKGPHSGQEAVKFGLVWHHFAHHCRDRGCVWCTWLRLRLFPETSGEIKEAFLLKLFFC